MRGESAGDRSGGSSGRYEGGGAFVPGSDRRNVRIGILRYGAGPSGGGPSGGISASYSTTDGVGSNKAVAVPVRGDLFRNVQNQTVQVSEGHRNVADTACRSSPDKEFVYWRTSSCAGSLMGVKVSPHASSRRFN